ncbi:hypothetical protein HID58_025777 [Brassica napus]|uniref:Hexosyltransferase n=1 Tax=Brassica napus TaxID=3708 RepID=A0ABQ8CM10_BRANA|nr:hypothetical protein HID58_025777 [Brassica napus]
MKKSKLDNSASHTRFGLVQFLLALLLFYFLCMSFEIPFIFRTGSGSDDGLPRHMVVVGREANRAIVGEEGDPHRPFEDPGRVNRAGHIHREFKTVSEIFTNETFFDGGGFADELSTFHETVKHAISTGRKMWGNLGSGLITKPNPVKNRTEKCPDTVSVTGSEFSNRSRILVLPCGLTLGSHGFVLEDATGLAVKGNIDVHSIYASSLPSTNPSFAPQKHLEMQSMWKAPALPEKPVELFIGILSAGNHFAERMAVRKSWMQQKLVRSSKVVARFFVALHARKEVNVDLKKEAEYFGDIVIVPYMDHYDLVVLKTVAICEYGVSTVAAKYIMKCDDDTFVRVDAVIQEAEKVKGRGSLYIGNINFYHKPLRTGKWAVTYEEWPEEYYPPYANGPGYILSYDIAKFIVDDFEHRRLRLFKMEDVSMGMWVEKFNETRPVEVVHSLRFCQFGCIEDYFTAHYQSPRQMICMWDKLQRLGKPHCCNMR